MRFNQAKHNRRSNRLKDYDYSQNGAYYVSICTINHDCILANIQSNLVGAGLAPVPIVPARNESTQNPLIQNENIINLTTVGEFVEKNWLAIPNRFENVFLDEYVIMLNHIHGIVLISATMTTARVAPTLGNIIGSFKSKCVIEYLRYNNDHDIDEMAKMWQCNYYEHIIRNEDELNRIRKYVRENPYRWIDDKENPDNNL